MPPASYGAEGNPLNIFRSPTVGDKVHYVSAFLPADGSNRKCIDATVTFVRVHPMDIDVDLCGVDENGNEFEIHWVMFRSQKGYWASESAFGFQPHSWHYPEFDEDCNQAFMITNMSSSTTTTSATFNPGPSYTFYVGGNNENR